MRFLCGLLLVLGALTSVLTLEPPSLQAYAQDGGWGTIRGQVVYAGDKLPPRVPLNVDKDKEHCLEKGPLFSEKWVVNPANKGVRWVAVFLKPAPGEKLPVHLSLQQPAAKEVVLDQPCCNYDPHVLAMRSDQKLLAKNPAPVGHNVYIAGLKNSQNIQIPPGKSQTLEVFAGYTPSKMTCGQHPWMEGYLWVFDHPYFTVTDADGKFEIKLAPAGKQNLIVWQEDVGYVGSDAKGRPIDVNNNAVTDLGKIEVKPRPK